ncbi:molybdenum cofactor guanylyltransferase [Erythrobacter litoralis]|uniref:Molybdenum cofactor guanylyltransferase n=1 Tax=Erythrobacter litoralis (strain HTCC2594) TaxID=314225 RepID=Q2N8Q3_ERYLH|nr:molybdenum cofactor guanylyltransferase [Erythrobacter litoralis]ABC63938.1 Probable molybdopterin-guanine [Erythrobacter litoralis HTCC2594]
MRVLGAILAGGRSRRFGSDKAHATIDGERLIDLVARSLAAQCEAVVVCGREEDGINSIPDWPEPGHGPLGGLNAALHHAAIEGVDAVLSCGCDVPNLPTDLLRQLEQGAPAIAGEQPVVGLWPVSLALACDSYLATGQRSLYGFADHVGARRVPIEPPLANINHPSDLPDR